MLEIVTGLFAFISATAGVIWLYKYFWEDSGPELEVEFLESTEISDSIVLRNTGNRTAKEIDLTLDAEGCQNPIAHVEENKLPSDLPPDRLVATAKARSLEEISVEVESGRLERDETQYVIGGTALLLPEGAYRELEGVLQHGALVDS